MKKTVVIQTKQNLLLSELIQLPDFYASYYSIIGPNEIYEYMASVPDTRVHLAISDDIPTLLSIPAEQKIIINSPAPPNSNWYAVTSISQIVEILRFDAMLTKQNITIGGSTYAL